MAEIKKPKFSCSAQKILRSRHHFLGSGGSGDPDFGIRGSRFPGSRDLRIRDDLIKGWPPAEMGRSAPGSALSKGFEAGEAFKCLAPGGVFASGPGRFLRVRRPAWARGPCNCAGALGPCSDCAERPFHLQTARSAPPEAFCAERHF